ncbi:MAG: molecular chaperone HtpG, partial [Proteobacteria bacterium]|nr:molecular chaperone HtpG [Pseudomonadota bacterium]
FSSTQEDKEEQTVSLMDYIERMSEDQEAIYYVIADNFSTAKNSPHLEIFRKKGIEVLLLSDPVDEWLTTHLTEYEGKTLQSVTKGELNLGKLDKEKDKTSEKEDSKQSGELLAKIKKILESKVKDVRVTNRLTHSPACLVADEHEMGRNLQRILQASGQDVPMSKPILEINIDHPVVKKLGEAEDEQFEDWSLILFDQALLSEGGELEDPAGFVHRLNNMFMALDSSAKDDQ